MKIFLISFLLATTFFLAGCPSNEPNNGDPDKIYHVGTWAGSLETKARLVMRVEPEYWNAAWKVEADVRMDEFQDGSLKGTARGNLFCWEKNDPLILNYDDIARGHWNKFSEFKIELNGTADDSGWVINAVELPISLPDPGNPGKIIDFWDFLYPSKLEGSWQSVDSRIISGQSMRVQGNDYKETSQQASFREFTIEYRWEINKL